MTAYPTLWRSVEQRGCGDACMLPGLRLERREITKGVMETRHVIPKHTLFRIADHRTFYVETDRKKPGVWLAEGTRPTSKQLYYGRGNSERQAVQNLLLDMGVATGKCWG